MKAVLYWCESCCKLVLCFIFCKVLVCYEELKLFKYSPRPECRVFKGGDNTCLLNKSIPKCRIKSGLFNFLRFSCVHSAAALYASLLKFSSGLLVRCALWRFPSCPSSLGF